MSQNPHTPAMTSERVAEIQALREDVARKLKEVRPQGSFHSAAQYFRLEDLLAESAELQSELERRPTPEQVADAWVKVSDQLPEPGKQVLTWDPAWVDDFTQRPGCIHKNMYGPGGWWLRGEPTHWKELPAPPTEF